MLNYQKELEKILIEQDRGKKLLLHSCCAPCSSYVLKYLSSFFEICVFYYNPNITEEIEYKKRVEEQRQFISDFSEREKPKNKISFKEGSYNTKEFYSVAKGYEECKEGAERCFNCYQLRLEKTARYAREKKIDFFATTLTISPLKNAKKINELGYILEKKEGIRYLPSDFKKQDGYKKSILLSKEYGLYRQDYCGCCYSKVK